MATREGTPQDSPSSLTVTERILYAIADRKGVSPEELNPTLYEVIDPDALADVIRSLSEESGAGRVVFAYAGYTVTVESNGQIHPNSPNQPLGQNGQIKPTAVFDISQTEGKPLPELETEATGDADDLVPALKDAADDIGVTVRIVNADKWEHGEAKGVCKYRSKRDLQPVVEAKARSNQADLAVTLIHEYAHALLHSDITDETERSKREVEAEAVAYIVGRYCGLDTSGSAFYLAAWQSDDSEVVQERLGRISSTAQEIIGSIEG